jgi:serine acetyltransferase
MTQTVNQVFRKFDPKFNNTPQNADVSLPNNKKLFQNFKQDMIGILETLNMEVSFKTCVWALVGMDAFIIMALFRLRKFFQAYRIPVLGRLLRLVQGILYGIELGVDVELGWGVHFVHSQGIVVGGHSRVGSKAMFYGCNTIGTSKNDGHPSIGDNATISAGVRVLGPISIGANAVLGANAVVLKSVPAGCVAVGIPAKVLDSKETEK